MRSYPTKEFSLIISLVLFLTNILTAGFAPSNISSYWGKAELIAIGSVGRSFNEVHGETAHYHLTITELIRGPELESLEDIEIINPAHANSNNRWNTGYPGTPSIFFGTWSEEDQAWIVPRAAKLHDDLMEAVEILRYVDASEDETEREGRLEEAFEKHNVRTVFYLFSEARRLNRDDLILAYYQRSFSEDPTYLNAADQMLRRNDLSPLPKLKEFLADPEFIKGRSMAARGDIVRMLSKHLKEEATSILKPYLNDENGFVSLAVAEHLMNFEEDSDKWMHVFQLARTTSNDTIRHNACYLLDQASDHIPLKGLKEIRDFVDDRDVSQAVLNGLNRSIERREKKFSKASSAEAKD